VSGLNDKIECSVTAILHFDFDFVGSILMAEAASGNVAFNNRK